MQPAINSANNYFNEVYYVMGGEGFAFNPVAIRPRIDPSQPNTLYWEDTARGVKLYFKTISQRPENLNDPKNANPDKITIYTPKGSKVELIKLTLEIFNKQVIASGQVAGNLHFDTDSELREFYLNEHFD